MTILVGQATLEARSISHDNLSMCPSEGRTMRCIVDRVAMGLRTLYSSSRHNGEPTFDDLSLEEIDRRLIDINEEVGNMMGKDKSLVQLIEERELLLEKVQLAVTALDLTKTGKVKQPPTSPTGKFLAPYHKGNEESNRIIALSLMGDVGESQESLSSKRGKEKCTISMEKLIRLV